MMKFIERIIEKHKIRVQNKEQLKRIIAEREKTIAEVHRRKSLIQYNMVREKIEKAINNGERTTFISECLYDDNYKKLKKEGFKINYYSLDNETFIHW